MWLVWPCVYLCADLQGFPAQDLGHLSAAGGEVEDGGSSHVCRLHVVCEVEAALAAGAAGAALSSSRSSSSSTAQAAAAGPVAAGGAARRTGALAVVLHWRDTQSSDFNISPTCADVWHSSQNTLLVYILLF